MPIAKGTAFVAGTRVLRALAHQWLSEEAPPSALNLRGIFRSRGIVLHQLRTSVAAARSLFAALVVLSGISVHLISELAGLGWHVDSHLIVSVHHIPLALLALAALSALGAVGCVIARRPNRKAAIAEIVRALPDGGCGWRFLNLAFAGQFAVFAVTQAGEGVPIDRGDFGLALIAALVSSVLGALLVSRSQRRLIEALGELFVVFVAAAAFPQAARSWKQLGAHVRVRHCRSIVFAGSRRPPPEALLI